jgi:hypothetical protein
MVASGAKLKAKIEAKIFKAPPASVVTILSRTTTSNTNGYYGFSSSTSSTTTLGVPYAFTRETQVYYNFGTDEEGQTKVALKADTSVKKGDLVKIASFTSKTFEVQDINDYPYHDTNLAIIVTVKELLE